MSISPPLLTLTTDFGTQDSYVSQMKGVILSHAPQARLVDLSHELPPQNVLAASLFLEQVVPTFPNDTIHLCVVDPGVGSQRRGVAVEFPSGRFVGPDNGLLTHWLEREQPLNVVELNQPQWWRQPVSRTFHGRDVFAPVAAAWCRGHKLDELGTAAQNPLVLLPQPAVVRTDEALTGEVIAVDHYGNLITNLVATDVEHFAAGHHVFVEVGRQTNCKIHACYADVPNGQLLALIGSSQRLEISVNCGHAAQTLNATTGTPVCVKPAG